MLETAFAFSLYCIYAILLLSFLDEFEMTPSDLSAAYTIISLWFCLVLLHHITLWFCHIMKVVFEDMKRQQAPLYCTNLILASLYCINAILLMFLLKEWFTPSTDMPMSGYTMPAYTIICLTTCYIIKAIFEDVNRQQEILHTTEAKNRTMESKNRRLQRELFKLSIGGKPPKILHCSRLSVPPRDEEFLFGEAACHSPGDNSESW